MNEDSFTLVSMVCGSIVTICLILFLAIPVKRSMEIDSIHWIWTIDIYEYQKDTEQANGRKHDSKRSAERYLEQDMNNAVPFEDGAYNVLYKIKQSSYTLDNNTYYEYYYQFTYDINQWHKISECYQQGNDKSPYEPECDLPVEVNNPKLTDRKRQYGHNETYQVNGIQGDKVVTYNIPKDVWEIITTDDEISYKKFRLGNTIWDIKIAE